MSEDDAVARWVDAIGVDHVITDAASLGGAATATFPTSSQVVALLRPADADGVAACLAVAYDMGVPVQPVSRGRNWGLGSRAPWARRAAVLELGRMDAISVDDEANGTITVQPGVTFHQVDVHLRARGSRFFLPCIGGPPDASVIGNALERGHGIGPRPRRVESIGAFDAVLADGSRVRCGSAPNDALGAGNARRHGAGPCLAGLFEQGGWGVVTAMTLSLERRPALLVPFVARIDDLAGLLDALPARIMDGSLGRCAMTVWNDAKRRACGAGERVTVQPRPFAPDDAEGWSLSGAFYAPSAAHLATWTAALQALRPAIAPPTVLDPAGPAAIAASAQFLGTPAGVNLRSMYSEKARDLRRTGDPGADRCGVIHICPLLPMARACTPLLQAISATASRYGLAAQIGFDCGDPRLIEAFVQISYDRDVAGEDERAVRCHDEIVQDLEACGAALHRRGLLSAGRSRTASSDGGPLHARLADALDSRRILTRPV